VTVFDPSPPAVAYPPPTAAAALRLLTDAVQELALASTVEDVQRVVRTAARRLTGADGATFVLRDSGQCFYADEDAIEPLWKGRRFPLEACISGWAMLNRRPAVIEDIYTDPRIPHEAYRPTFVRSLVMVPIRTLDPVGAIGIYWARTHRATTDEIGLARALADSTAVALQNVRANDVNARLEREVRASQDAEVELREMAETDALTGLPNRRGWDRLLDTALAAGHASVHVALLDIDRFKDFNDRNGHQGGDRLLVEAGREWREQLRPGDTLARYGGEEFAAVLVDCDDDAALAVAQRLRCATPGGQTTSIGLARWDGVEGAEPLVGRADTALYRAKQDGRDRVAVVDVPANVIPGSS
jgi:diguanylate cyclase (GGDEF)-like protein